MGRPLIHKATYLFTLHNNLLVIMGYFVSIIADVDEATIKKYVEEQFEESMKEE